MKQTLQRRELTCRNIVCSLTSQIEVPYVVYKYLQRKVSPQCDLVGYMKIQLSGLKL